MAEAFIYDAVRSPRGKGRSDGALHEITPVNLATQMLDAVVERNGLAEDQVEDVAMGCVTAVGEQGGCIGRTAVLMSKLGEGVPGYQLNRFCASGLEAVCTAAEKVGSGAVDLAIGAGVECMSRVPMASDGAAIAVDPQASFATYFVPQGIAADLIATKYGFSREDCDAYSVESQRRAKKSWDEGRFEKSIVPVRDVVGDVLLDRDEAMRPETDMQSLGALSASFQGLGEVMPGFNTRALLKYPELEKINHVHHAGNSSGIVDGSAAVLVGSAAAGDALGKKPRARIKSWASVGSEPTIMLTGPSFAAEKALKKAGMTAADIDLWELNEAFASVVLRFMQALDVDHDKINVNGGAIAMGHPLGATGAMIMGAAVDELERSGKSTALVTLCVAAGMGSAAIIERV